MLTWDLKIEPEKDNPPALGQTRYAELFLLGTYSTDKSWASAWLSGDYHASTLSAHHPSSQLQPQLTHLELLPSMYPQQSPSSNFTAALMQN